MKDSQSNNLPVCMAPPMGRLQVVGGTQFQPGKRPKRAKAKHLGVTMRRVCVRQFGLHQNEEDAARAIAEPGVTGRTVLSTVVLDLVQRIEQLERQAGYLRCA